MTSAAVLGEDIYLLSHQGAPHYQVIKVHASDPAVSRGKIVVPPSASVIRGIAAARDGVYLQDLNAGIGGLRRLARDGSVTAVAMPFSDAINGLNTDTLHDGAWFLLQGWVQPSVVCRAEADGRVAQTAIAPKPPIDVSAYVSDEVTATAADGARVPLSIIYWKGLQRDGSAPLLLEAYGSYVITIDPAFLARWLPLLDLGGVFAVAHVGGGGELGEDWHRAGQKLNKPNTWRDTIAAAGYLITQRYVQAELHSTIQPDTLLGLG